MSQPTDLVTTLLEADAAERERLLRSIEPTTLEGALVQLGQRREPAAAEVLAMVDQVVDDRALRKIARREVHRLRSVGVQTTAPPPVASVSAPAAVRSDAPVPVTDAWATDVDRSGARAIWMTADRPLGGIWFAVVLANDLRGMEDMNLFDTTRKRFQHEFEANRRDAGTWVSLPGAYALALVREAVDVTREQQGSLPTRYPALRNALGEAPSGPERALVYETISPVEVNFNPDWLEDSARLLSEPELGGWYVPLPVELRSRALEAARAGIGGLLVPGHSPEQQAQQLLIDAAHEGLTPPVRRAIRRRLEETAYILLQTDRLGAARLAVAAAQGLDDAGAGRRMPAERQPLLRTLLATGLARLVIGEQLAGHDAAEVLMRMIDSAGDSERQAQGGALETRPSGLILPR